MGPLARHLNQPQFGYLRYLPLHTISVLTFFQDPQNLSPMFFIFHINEVDNDDTAHVS